MEAFQERVIAEKKELDSKRESLISFMHTDKFNSMPVDEKGDMQLQREIMRDYSTILTRRISRFNPTSEDKEESQ